MSDKTLDQRALEYHRQAPAGKLQIQPTKPLATQRDLALAYSPGVAAACTAIVDDPMESYQLTNRANLVAVITNGKVVQVRLPILAAGMRYWRTSNRRAKRWCSWRSNSSQSCEPANCASNVQAVGSRPTQSLAEVTA